MRTVSNKAKVAVVAVTVVLSGCGQTQVSGEQTAMLLGGALGGAAGGYVGSQFGAGLGQTLFIVAGASAGALVGASAGPGLFGTDWGFHVDATENAMKDVAAEPTYWSNPKTGNEGMIRPMEAYVDTAGTPCRKYRATISVDGVIASGDGAACQSTNGQWRVVADQFG